MSIIVMSLSQYTSHYDRAPLSRAIDCWRTLIGVDDLISSCPIFRGEDRSLGSDPPSMSGARGRKRGTSSVGCAGELLLTLEPGSLSQNIEVEKCCFLLLGYFVVVV